MNKKSNIKKATHKAACHNNCKFAFTLAETLITLGIIGVVAAMTMPVLINNYNKSVTVSRLKKSYSTMMNAIALSEVDNGGIDQWDYTIDSTEYFEKYLKPYLNGARVCSNMIECGYDSNYTGSLREQFTGMLWEVKTDSSRILFKLIDGSVVFWPRNTVGSTGGILYVSFFYIDTNGPKRPNRIGEDVFLICKDSKNCIYNRSSMCTSNLKLGCFYRILEKGWKIDY